MHAHQEVEIAVAVEIDRRRRVVAARARVARYGSSTGSTWNDGVLHVAPMFSISSTPGSKKSPQNRSRSLSPSKSANASAFAPWRVVGPPRRAPVAAAAADDLDVLEAVGDERELAASPARRLRSASTVPSTRPMNKSSRLVAVEIDDRGDVLAIEEDRLAVGVLERRRRSRTSRPASLPVFR